MKLTIRSRHVHLTPDVLEQIRRRITLSFERISSRIRAIDVTITDVNGPRGGPDKQCRLRVRGRSIAGIVVEQIGSDPVATIGAVTERAERAVLRSVARRRALDPAFAL